tara:strand:- start:315 stop:560 length:246 start_codon:yes stop_codon:yes gene_type:complete
MLPPPTLTSAPRQRPAQYRRADPVRPKAQISGDAKTKPPGSGRRPGIATGAFRSSNPAHKHRVPSRKAHRPAGLADAACLS